MGFVFPSIWFLLLVGVGMFVAFIFLIPPHFIKNPSLEVNHFSISGHSTRKKLKKANYFPHDRLHDMVDYL